MRWRAGSCGRGCKPAIAWPSLGANSVEVVNLYFACFKAGLIAVPVNNRLKASEIAYILEHSKAELCFSQPELASLCEEACADSPDLQRIYTMLPKLDSTEPESIELPEISPDRIAAIFVHVGHHGAAQRSDAYTRFAHCCYRAGGLAGPGRGRHHAADNADDAYRGAQLRAAAGNMQRRNGGFASCVRCRSVAGFDRTMAMLLYDYPACHAAVRCRRTESQSA